MRVTFGSIVLNEEQYILANLQQHYDFCDEWIIVEGADVLYPADRLTGCGLSVDKTAEIIRDFASTHPKIQFIQQGWAQDKSALRNRYADRAKDGILVVLDIDEFLTHASLTKVIAELQHWPSPGCLRIPHVHLWKNTSQIITGSYYDIPHNRCYRWPEETRYMDNHNHPADFTGTPLHSRRLQRRDRSLQPRGDQFTHDAPFFLHYGFVKDPVEIAAKNQYYRNRGEVKTRPETTTARAAWFADETPPHCDVKPWIGPYPEVFM